MGPGPLPDSLPGFGPLPDMGAQDANAARNARTPWQEADVTRAIRAAEKAGLRAYRVDATPDGTISIVVGAP